MSFATLGYFYQMQKDVEARLAVLTDISTLLSIEKSSEMTTWNKEKIQASFFQNDDIWLFNDLSKREIGYAIFRSDGDALELLQFCLNTPYRRQGLGKQCLQWCLHYYQASHQAIFLEVAVDNLAAIQCYQSLGFEVIGERKGYYWRQGARIDAQVMRFVL